MVCCRYNILQICTTSIAILLNVSFTRTAIQFYIIQETQHMDGYEFEYQCAKILKRKHFSKIKVTQSSGDQGIDIIAFKHRKKYGIPARAACACKRERARSQNHPSRFPAPQPKHRGAAAKGQYLKKPCVMSSDTTGAWTRQSRGNSARMSQSTPS